MQNIKNPFKNISNADVLKLFYYKYFMEYMKLSENMSPICNNAPNTQPTNMLNNEEYNKNKYAYIANIEKEPALIEECNENKYAYIINKQSVEVPGAENILDCEYEGDIESKKSKEVNKRASDRHDHWLREDRLHVRVHSRERRELFTPLRVSGSPPARELFRAE